MITQTPVLPLNPALPWQGGKCRLAARLVTRIEALPHQLYAEPFVGMGGVFLRRRLRPRLEVINDFSRDVANFFRVLQRHPNTLLEEMLNWQVAARAEFDRQQRVDPETLTDIERAARFYYLQRLSYSGKASGRSFGISPGHGNRFNVRHHRRLLERIHERLSAVMVECLPFDEFIPRYDRADALFYLDPPYFGGENDYGKGMFHRRDFARLAGILGTLKGRFLLSLNDTPEVRDIFSDFHIESVETRYSIGNADRGAPVAELIISDGAREGDGLVRQARLL